MSANRDPNSCCGPTVAQLDATNRLWLLVVAGWLVLNAVLALVAA